MTEPSYRRGEMMLAGGICILALIIWVAFRLYTGLIIEDAFITYRYAQNLAQGNGFVYNVGEHVLGTTTPLFTLILAGMGGLVGVEHIPTISTILMIIAGLAAGWITFLALRKLDVPHWLPAFFLAAFLLNFNVLWAMTGGLETPLVLLFMSASLYMLIVNKSVWAGVFAALLVLTRIDGTVWAAGVYIVILLQDKRAFRKAALTGALILLPWLLFAWSYFGSPIPNTVAAKSTIGHFDDYSSSVTMASYLGWGLLHLSRISPFARVIGFLLFALGGWATFRRDRSTTLKLVVVFPFVFLLAYYIGHAPKFPWYLIPLIWAGILVGALGLWEAGRLLRDVLPDRFRTAQMMRWGMTIFLVVYAMALVNRGWTTTRFHHDWMLEENHVRKQVALWLRDHTSEDATVAMEAIGYQGYFSGRRVIDFAGLISPEVVELYRKTGSNAQVFYSIVTTSKPDYIVLREFEVASNQCFLGGPLFEDGDQRIYFSDTYSEKARFEPYNRDVGGWLFDLTIYERK